MSSSYITQEALQAGHIIHYGWRLKDLMTDAGVEIAVFCAPSTRAAATTATKVAGLQIEDIMKMAD